MKNTIRLMTALSLCVIFLLGCRKDPNTPIYLTDPPKGGYLGEYDIKDYEDKIEQCPSDKNVGPIVDADDAIEKGVSVLIDMYGEEIINDEEPFKTYYDPNSDTWLIQGSMDPMVEYPDGRIIIPHGGVGEVIINASDGDVIAAWHGQ